MTDSADFTTAYTDGEIDTNRSDNPSLLSIVEARYSRRQTMMSGGAAMSAAVLSSSLLAACGDDGDSGSSYLDVQAGQGGQTSAGRIVTINGTAAGNVASTTWTQVSGPAVTISDPSARSITFTAPGVAQTTALVFRLTATGSNGTSLSSDTTITVNPAQLGFTAVAKGLGDVVAVPTGYTVSVLYRLGDPIASGVSAFANNGTDTDFDKRAGDHHDALYYFGLAATGNAPDPNNSSRGLLVMNHENITQAYLHPNGPTAGTRPEAEALKEMLCHGVSVIEVTRAASGGAWSYVQGSALNRRVTPLTPTRFNGPARGDAQLRTAFSPAGTDGRGTINNCANGHTAWSTDLTCEENWAGYFRRASTDTAGRTAAELTSLNRYGVNTGGNYGWSTVTPADATSTIFRRWDARATGATATDDFRNEPNQFGWVVEIDPYDPTSTPRKRTALGRFGHEGAWPGKFVAGVKPAIYMGDDNRNDYLYKFVSATPWVAADATATDRLAIGDKYLDNGTLHVAKFNADGTGTWIPLVFGQNGITAASTVYPFQSQADVLINTRLAADIVGATKMDRPEWTAVNPANGEMYLTLTNTNASSRPVTATDAANPRHYNDPRGATAQYGNPNGHIIRLHENGDTTEATGFKWDIYVFGAGADLNPTNINISVLDNTNDFSSCDGLWFGRPSNASGQVTPVLWIQTDDGAYTDVTNCMMLAAIPGQVGDGAAVTITNVAQDGTQRQQATIVGKAPGTTLRRFLVGPKECELTGVDSTPDGKTLFVNIQHPGELGTGASPTSNWPASQTGGTTGRPRSATIVITKDDGGVVAL